VGSGFVASSPESTNEKTRLFCGPFPSSSAPIIAKMKISYSDLSGNKHLVPSLPKCGTTAAPSKIKIEESNCSEEGSE